MSSFAEGFADAFIGRVNARKDRIAERVEEQRRMLKEEGLKRQAAMTQQRDILSSATARLIGSGMEEGKVKALLQEDPRMLAEVAEMGLSGDDLNALIEVKEEYDIDTPLRDLVAQASPAFATITTDPVQKKSNILGRILGFDSEGIMDTEVYGAELLPGVTGAQISASRGEPTLGGRRSGGIGYNFGAIEEDEITPNQKLLFLQGTSTAIDAAIEQRIQELNDLIVSAPEDQKSLITTELTELDKLKKLTDQPWDRRLMEMQKISPSVVTRLLSGPDGEKRLTYIQDLGYGHIIEPFLTSIEETTGTAPSTTIITAGGEGIEEGTPASGELVVAEGEIEGSPRPKKRPVKDNVLAEPTSDGGWEAVLDDVNGETVITFNKDKTIRFVKSVNKDGKLVTMNPGDPGFEEFLNTLELNYKITILPEFSWGSEETADDYTWRR